MTTKKTKAAKPVRTPQSPLPGLTQQEQDVFLTAYLVGNQPKDAAERAILAVLAHRSLRESKVVT